MEVKAGQVRQMPAILARLVIMLNMAVEVVLVVRWKTILVLLDVWAVLLYLVRVLEVQVVPKLIPTVGMVEPGEVIQQAVEVQGEIVLVAMQQMQ